ncbi:MAG: DUF308 domain-containing protein [Erysipelotrichaceae bacterium]|nr:DUF308 domain-containing protein [Erysipelotrichaceae bacterium]
MIFLRSLKKGMIVISIALALMGYFVLTQKEMAATLVLNVFAYGLMACGLLTMLHYFFLKIEDRYKRNDFVVGLIFIVLGFVVLFSKTYLSTILTYVFGIVNILIAVLFIQDFFDAKRIGVKSFGMYFSFLAISIAFGVLIIMNPFKSNLIYIIAGLSLIYCGITYFISNIFLAFNKAKYEKKLLKEKEEKEKEETAAVEEVKEEEPVKEEESETKFERIDLD